LLDVIAIFCGDSSFPSKETLAGITKDGRICFVEFEWRKKGWLSTEIDPNSLQDKVTSWSILGGFEKPDRTSDVITWDDIIGDAPDIDTSILNW